MKEWLKREANKTIHWTGFQPASDFNRWMKGENDETNADDYVTGLWMLFLCNIRG
jgi:hypothetical protein